MELTDIQRFYENRSVFLTDATGFLGKLFLEKVLRSLPVKKVYVLWNNNEDVSVAKKIEDLFQSEMFDTLIRTVPDVVSKVSIMRGDCSLPNLGLSDHDQNIFIKEVEVVFHCAPAGKFEEDLRNAVYTNVRATMDLVNLAKRSKIIKSFLYVGTAYANSNRTEIREEIYPSKMSAKTLISICEGLDEEVMPDIKNKLISGWPNSYTFASHVAESFLQDESGNLPICIARPSIVTSTSSEPLVGFMDSSLPMAVYISQQGLGISRITYNPNVIMDIVPGDFVINQCIALAWETGKNFKPYASPVSVYNISSGLDNPIHHDDVAIYLNRCIKQYAPKEMVLYPLHFTTRCKYSYLFWRFFLHTLVAYVMDLILKVQGKSPIFANKIKKIHAYQETYEPFVTNSFFFHVENTQKLLRKMSFADRELFKFDIRTLNWEDYFVTYVKGVRVFLLKDMMDTLTQSHERYNYLKRVMIVVSVSLFVVFYGLSKIFLFRILPLAYGIVSYFFKSLVC